jgi:protein-L-isoaspartate(D-aspartate) O-methyltransferase
MIDQAIARQNMVESQIRPNSVTDWRIIDAMSAVPRELFLPAEHRSIAYMDEDVEFAPGRYVMEPRVFARMVQLAGIEDGSLVLDIGCGYGYSSAILARLAGTVVALEDDETLANEASELLADQGVDNVAVIAGSLSAGLATEGPYDAIVINGEVSTVPQDLLAQLKDGGRLVAVVASRGIGKACVFQRSGETFSDRIGFDASASGLPGFEAVDPGFVF